MFAGLVAGPRSNIDMMDQGSFYGRRMHSDSTASAGWLPGTENYYTLHVDRQLPSADSVFINQKLDRILASLETQFKEIESIKSETTSMKTEIECLKQKGIESSCSSSTPSSAKKVTQRAIRKSNSKQC